MFLPEVLVCLYKVRTYKNNPFTKPQLALEKKYRVASRIKSFRSEKADWIKLNILKLPQICPKNGLKIRIATKQRENERALGLKYFLKA